MKKARQGRPLRSRLEHFTARFSAQNSVDAPTQVRHHALLDQLQQELGLCGHIMHSLEIHGSHALIVKIMQRCIGLTEIIAKTRQTNFIAQVCG